MEVCHVYALFAVNAPIIRMFYRGHQWDVRVLTRWRLSALLLRLPYWCVTEELRGVLRLARTRVRHVRRRVTQNDNLIWWRPQEKCWLLHWNLFVNNIVSSCIRIIQNWLPITVKYMLLLIWFILKFPHRAFSQVFSHHSSYNYYLNNGVKILQGIQIKRSDVTV